MNTSIPKRLQTYINEELHDVELYKFLAKSAPNEETKDMLFKFADCEQKHADEFLRLYKLITGYTFEPEVLPVTESGSYRAIIRNRIIDELNGSEKYRNEYLKTDNFQLKRAFFNAFNDELQHAVSIIYILI